MQSDIVIGETEITGTLKYVSGYTGFSAEPSEQAGNYMALKMTVDPPEAVTTVEVVGGTKGPVTLESDMNIVLLIKNTTQSIKVISTLGKETITKTYALTNLTLTPQG